MAKFIELTYESSGLPILLNISNIFSVRRNGRGDEGCSVIANVRWATRCDLEQYIVKDSYESVVRRLNGAKK